MPGGTYLIYSKPYRYIYMYDSPNVLSLLLFIYTTEKQDDWLEQSLYENALSSARNRIVHRAQSGLDLWGFPLTQLCSPYLILKWRNLKVQIRSMVSLIVSLCPEVSSITASTSDTSRFTDARFWLSQSHSALRYTGCICSGDYKSSFGGLMARETGYAPRG